MNNNFDELSIATLRSLCIDMINKANSGHPGIALGAAPIIHTLYSRHLVANPKDPAWSNRDRFVLSAGHGSSLLYAQLHLCGYAISLDDLKNFRQLHSLTPGHPECGWTPGVDATSGPLGQGIAQAVGLAMAEQMVAHAYPHGDMLCSHYTYCLCGDGCLEEGISQEAISYAGHQKLNKLILLYDSNNVTLDGSLELSNSDNAEMRFKASNWNVIRVSDGNNVNEIDNAIKQAKKSKDKPTLIIVETVIGYGASKAGTSKVHGSPLGAEDGKRTKVEVYHFDHDDFYVPDEVYKFYESTFINRGKKAYEEYQDEFVTYSSRHKTEAARYLALKDNDVSKYLPSSMPDFDIADVASRKSSQKALNSLMLSLPNLFGGSADVEGSVMTKINDGKYFSPSCREGHSINFGIREFAMASIQNGILLHGGIRTYVGAFFVFSDYLKPAVRMAALSNLPAIYLFSHDSIAVGEDGPTHQPIEQLAMLRSIPNVNVIRPCDERETFAAWNEALKSNKTPTAIILSRQNLPLIPHSDAEGLSKGAYVISNMTGAKFILIASGSEVKLALDAQAKLKEEGISTKVVSMPSWELFEKTNDEYKAKVFDLPKSKRISVEMLSSFGWDRYADHHLSVDTFGASGKANDVINDFNFTTESLVQKVKGIK